jgi:hypothetical protein
LCFELLFHHQQQQSLLVPNKLGVNPTWAPSHGSGTSIAAFQALLSKQRSLGISQPFRSLFIASPHISFGLPLPLLTLVSWLRISQCTGASEGLLWTWPNHLNLCWTSFSSIGDTPRRSRISSFQTRSILVWSQIHRNIRIFATLSCWTCRLFVGQHSAQYNIAGLIAVL